jgi:glycerate 2-kinase
VAHDRPKPDDLLHECLAAIRAACDPAAITREAMTSPPVADWLRGARPDTLLAIGKASAAMAAAAVEILGPPPAGLVIAPPEVGARTSIPGAEILPADHPTPTARNLAAAQRAAALVNALAPESLLLCLISGGGSAHLAMPADGVTLDDIATLATALMRSGADIRALNTVRKHCEQLKGGGLARLALNRNASVIALIFSDVVGDPLDVVASGPLSPDHTTFAGALAILDRFDCRNISPAITRRLEAGARGEIPETLKPADPVLADPDRLRGHIIANHERPARAAAEICRQAGLRVDLQTGVEAPAADVGRGLARAVTAAGPGAAIIRAGEWTVDARDAPEGARGGPSQELALAAAVELAGHPAHVLAYSTDGVDGPTSAAGATIDGATCARAQKAGVDCAESLRAHDSHTALLRLGVTIPGAPTGTNLNHVAVGMMWE